MKYKKLLCTTILPNSTFSPLSIFIGEGTGPSIYLSSCHEIPGTRAVQVTLETRSNDHSGPVHATHGALDLRTLHLIEKHSRELFNRLFNVTVPKLDLTWIITIQSNSPANTYTQLPNVSLTVADREYIQLSQIDDFKGDCCNRRDTMVIPSLPSAAVEPKVILQYAMIFESAVLEAYLLCKEHEFAESHCLCRCPHMFRHVIFEGTRRIKDRISAERQRALGVSTASGESCAEMWDLLTSALCALRQQGINSETLRGWKNIIHKLINAGEGPKIRDLLELQPFKDIEGLWSILESESISVEEHRNLMDFIRLSLHRLEAEAQSRRLDCLALRSSDFSLFSPNLPAPPRPPRNVVVCKATHNASKMWLTSFESFIHSPMSHTRRSPP
ncbi:hypothetical protein L218DRAFT_1079653 [Marasmius fiardii PR-910]|nr:hypothetical protein L218DRAFT_1079653 [Marasmius fiardii PR-910]